MFERYTDKARRAIFFAREEASHLGATTIEAEHILLGLFRGDKALVYRVLGSHLPIESIRKEIESWATSGKKLPTTVDMPLSREAMRILEHAAEESNRLGHALIGTEHLLAGVLQERGTIASQLLQQHGATLEAVRAQLIHHQPVQPKEDGTKRIRKAVFPAAGLGTRFLPATKAQPKEMLPLVDKPLIQYVVEEAIDSGIEQIIVVTGRGKNSIEDHFDISYELEQMLQERGKEKELALVRRISDLMQFVYVRQKQALGLGHAVLVARDVVDEEPFAVMLGDDIIDAEMPCLKQMIEVFDRYQNPVVGIMPIEGPDISRFGVIQAEQVEPRVYRISDMVEKPRPEEAPSNLAIIGRYILTPDIFEEIENTTPGAGGEIQLTDAMRSLLKRRPFYGYQFEGRRYDAGDKLGFLKATVEFALKHDDISQEFREYLKSLKL
jgi:UTP--glucose-1-phosphate uridylyltransferase